MPSKDILSIREFQIVDGQDQPELYSRAFALPQFFTTNFVHDSRIVKIFTGENALLKAFYFNYMKLALESQDSEEYISLLKDKFVSFDVIQEGQLEDKFLSDFQYRKFFKDFIDVAKQNPTPDFQSTAQKYPIIDRVLQKLFKTVVPIGLFFSQIDQSQSQEFDIAVQVISYLSQEFQQEFAIQNPGKCINFVPTDMHLYFENMHEIYLTYVDEFQDEKDEKIHKFQNSAKSSFVCGEGNSFTSKFKSKSHTGKHPFQKADLNTVQNNSISSSEAHELKKTQSSCYLQNIQRRSSKQIQFDEQQETKSRLLERNSILIRRRSKNLQLKQHKKVSLLQPKSCYQYEEQNGNGNSSLVNSGIKSDNQDDDKEKANTLINILDSRVTESNSGLSPLPSSLLQKGSDKFTVITRRNIRKSKTMVESDRKDEYESDDGIKPITGQQAFMTDSAKQLSKLQCEYGMPINLPQPQFKEQKLQKSLQNVQTNPTSCYTFKTTVVKMEEILELGEDEDTQNSIQQFCQLQYPNPMSQKTVNLSENLSHKIMIGIIQSRNYNISKTSLGHTLTPFKMDANPSFFQDSDTSSLSVSSSVSRSVSRNEELQKSIYNPQQPLIFEQQKKSFQEFMKEMKEKIPFSQKHKNQVDSILNINQKNQFSKVQKPTIKQFYREETSHVNFDLTSSNKPSQMTIASKIKIQTPIKIQPLRNLSIIKQSEQKIFENQTSWMPTGTDEFTKSDILLLLDEEYRSKIRAIKNQYKSIIKEDNGSLLCKENYKSGIDNQNMSLMKESRQNRAKNESEIRNYGIINNDSRISNRSRETSIYVDER